MQKLLTVHLYITESFGEHLTRAFLMHFYKIKHWSKSNSVNLCSSAGCVGITEIQIVPIENTALEHYLKCSNTKMTPNRCSLIPITSVYVSFTWARFSFFSQYREMCVMLVIHIRYRCSLYWILVFLKERPGLRKCKAKYRVSLDQMLLNNLSAASLTHRVRNSILF